jgi:hypothetical protein
MASVPDKNLERLRYLKFRLINLDPIDNLTIDAHEGANIAEAIDDLIARLDRAQLKIARMRIHEARPARTPAYSRPQAHPNES